MPRVGAGGKRQRPTRQYELCYSHSGRSVRVCSYQPGSNGWRHAMNKSCLTTLVIGSLAIVAIAVALAAARDYSTNDVPTQTPTVLPLDVARR